MEEMMEGRNDEEFEWRFGWDWVSFVWGGIRLVPVQVFEVSCKSGDIASRTAGAWVFSQLKGGTRLDRCAGPGRGRLTSAGSSVGGSKRNRCCVTVDEGGQGPICVKFIHRPCVVVTASNRNSSVWNLRLESNGFCPESGLRDPQERLEWLARTQSQWQSRS